MRAVIVAVGSEMLTPFRVDTNSLAITERLNAVGYDVRLKVVVGDDVDAVARAIDGARNAGDLVICTGGLGPTEDDVTREALARVLDVPLDLDEAIVERIRARFAARGLTMAPINGRQALVPRGATVLDNPHGSAPGLWVDRGGVRIVLLPGPPREMGPMLDAVIRDRLASALPVGGLFRRTLRIAGRTESDVDSVAEPVYRCWLANPIAIRTTILAVLGQIELHLTAAASSRAEADRALDAAVHELEETLGESVFSTDGRLLEAVVGDLLRCHGLTIAVAESCTGGLLLSRLTDVPGSSDYVDRGVVCYSNRAKVDELGVPDALLAEHGAVSEPVALAMAAGVRRRAATDVGIGVTGIAGPGGGTPDKPVGTVAVAVMVGARTHVRTFRFLGARDHVKYQAAQGALNMLRLSLLEGP